MLEDTDRAISRRGVELLDRLGLRQAAHRSRSRARALGARAPRMRSGTTAFNASGDLAGLECKGGDDWDSPPGPTDIGLDSVASLPEMTSVGGTTSVHRRHGGWLAEQAWFDVPLSQGTGGGVSTLFDRPAVAASVARTGCPERQHGQAADPGHRPPSPTRSPA